MKKLLLLLVLILPTQSFGAITLPWTTSFNCNDWDQSMGLTVSAVNCDGLAGWGGWTTTAGAKEQITAPANYSSGGGGKGQRHWKGDGHNNSSGGLSFSFTASQDEIWIRYYARYQSGFTWNPLSYSKEIYFYTGAAFVFEPYGANQMNLHVNADARQNLPSAVGTGWNHIMGGTTSDGLFHCYEFHVKMDTNGSDGVGEIWVDSVQILNKTDVNWGHLTNPTGNFSGAIIGSNQDNPNNGADEYEDFDDISISATSRPGCLSGGGGGGTLNVSPAGQFNSTGKIGGSFSPVSQDYVLQNTESGTINWTASKTQNWLTLSSTGGSLTTGTSVTVTATINSGANSLVAGTYNDTITITNTTDHVGDTTRTVQLIITSPSSGREKSSGRSPASGRTPASGRGSTIR